MNGRNRSLRRTLFTPKVNTNGVPQHTSNLLFDGLFLNISNHMSVESYIDLILLLFNSGEYYHRSHRRRCHHYTYKDKDCNIIKETLGIHVYVLS